VASSGGQKASDRKSAAEVRAVLGGGVLPGDNIPVLFEADVGEYSTEFAFQNLCARQSRVHLIKLAKTIAIHAYATNI